MQDGVLPFQKTMSFSAAFFSFKVQGGEIKHILSGFNDVSMYICSKYVCMYVFKKPF